MSSPNIPVAVRAWADKVVLPTYPVLPADLNPVFLEKRVYQGSSGKVYPNPFTDRVASEAVDQKYEAVFLENEFIRLMILPEIGGRIHIGQDKTNGYDFFYRQNVIKPALVGLLGPWISGGVEFNWPQHHRPSTYMPVHWEIEELPDGSKTVWLSEHEPMNRMKGMVGICLHPGKALVEAKARLFNRTPFTQSFLWWANVGIRVHDQYQAFFPQDVTFVADHAKRAMSSFPIARNYYYGVDYRSGVDISWYKNIPVPTSYMVTESQYDFFGGYDHAAQAGMVHVANRFVAPGKKLWTWGNADFGYAWDRELTDADGPYIELMAGVYTDNQPDFSWLLPYETKSFSQFWYPIQKMGPAKNANQRIAVNLERENGAVRIGVSATESFRNARVTLSNESEVLAENSADLSPGAPYVSLLHPALADQNLTLAIYTEQGEQLISWTEKPTKSAEHLPATATEPAAPQDVETVEELYLIGLHLAQYRHATRYPEPYWQEALRRDPLDSRSNTALGVLQLQRGLFSAAAEYFRRALDRLTKLNPNTASGETHYFLGLTLLYQGKTDEAYAAFYKATWNWEWRSAAFYHLACIDCRNNQWDRALEHLERSLGTNQEHLKARNLKTAILRRLGHSNQALALASSTQRLDPLDFWSRYELALLLDASPEQVRKHFLASTRGDVQLHLDLAFDYAAAGLILEAMSLLTFIVPEPSAGAYPMALYALADFAAQSADEAAVQWRKAAATASPNYCFPSRLEEMLVLERALSHDPLDAKGHYYLGNLYYDRKRYEDAIRNWERSVDLDPAFSIPSRNLGIAYFNVRHDAPRALKSYERARHANPQDARLLYEEDQLRKRMGFTAKERLAILEQRAPLVELRDDLTVELVTLLNQVGNSHRALEILLSRRFHPWEGGEGLVSGQYVCAHRLLGIAALARNDPADALQHFIASRIYPHNLGEGKHLLTEELDLDYFTGLALEGLGQMEEASAALSRSAHAEARSSWMAYYKVLALRRLGEDTAAAQVLGKLEEEWEAMRGAKPKIDYFATSLPNLLLFDDNLDLRHEIECDFVQALLGIASGRSQSSQQLLSVLRKNPNHLPALTELARTTASNESDRQREFASQTTDDK